MKITFGKNTFEKTFSILLLTLVATASCKKSTVNNNTSLPNYRQVNLVADLGSYGPEGLDTNLINPWGIAIGPTGAFWISDNHTGLTTIYDNTGKTLLNPVAVPFHGQNRGGAPTGVVFNATSDFIAPAPGGTSKKAFFIYATENGTVSIWNGGDSTYTVADRSGSGAVYKGIALGSDGGANFIYLADFKNGKIDVLDRNFSYVNNKPFIDPAQPSGFAPFNIKSMGNKLFVAYAKQKAPDNTDDQGGPGNGYVDVFNPDGSFVKRFASGGSLNSPWGLAQATAGFGLPANSILVGNFGDGRINIFDSTGNYQGQIMSKGNPLVIDGLWEITFEDAGIQGSDPNALYFTAGPSGENHGIFGSLLKQ